MSHHIEPIQVTAGDLEFCEWQAESVTRIANWYLLPACLLDPSPPLLIEPPLSTALWWEALRHAGTLHITI
jgi:hypothetical protein